MMDQVNILLANNAIHKQYEEILYVPRFKQRLAVVGAWSIPPGSRVLDIGVGQAIDPASLEYGSPYTLGEAQAMVLRAPLGSQITFKQADTETFIKSLGGPADAVFDAATFCHSLWYFPTLDLVKSAFKTLGDASTPAIYVAEYLTDDQVSLPDQKAHHLAAKAQAIFHADVAARKTFQTQGDVPAANIRAAPDREFILQAAKAAGYVPVRQGVVTPEADYYEGHVEVNHVITKFSKRVKEANLDPAKEAEILQYVPLVQKEWDESRERGLRHARCIDVWWAEFRLSA
ncbi:hypothetical protein F5Y17DRAFT_457427 [Xylariaceae sp. FL0594]|nr:hypothetical protein F5Y17DRAFT_457427 [Xylariaceae sp. FL0594]